MGINVTDSDGYMRFTERVSVKNIKGGQRVDGWLVREDADYWLIALAPWVTWMSVFTFWDTEWQEVED